eukprot:1160719-Pelagomonas_calceolata.AAC.1
MFAATDSQIKELDLLSLQEAVRVPAVSVPAVPCGQAMWKGYASELSGRGVPAVQTRKHSQGAGQCVCGIPHIQNCMLCVPVVNSQHLKRAHVRNGFFYGRQTASAKSACQKMKDRVLCISKAFSQHLLQRANVRESRTASSASLLPTASPRKKRNSQPAPSQSGFQKVESTRSLTSLGKLHGGQSFGPARATCACKRWPCFCPTGQPLYPPMVTGSHGKVEKSFVDRAKPEARHLPTA